MLYGKESWPVKKEDGIILANDAGMARLMCNINPDDRISSEELKTRLKLKSTRECLHGRRLQWFGHLERMEESAWFSKCRIFSSSIHRGRPRKICNEVIRSDLKLRKVSKDIAKDRNVK